MVLLQTTNEDDIVFNRKDKKQLEKDLGSKPKIKPLFKGKINKKQPKNKRRGK